MDMIFIHERHRRCGAGTALFEFWTTKMQDNGARILMTSSEAEEKAPQEWHYRNGFKESGRLTFGQLDLPTEIFLVKNL
jgi:L-amino acid N-acyltransferase YncA